MKPPILLLSFIEKTLHQFINCTSSFVLLEFYFAVSQLVRQISSNMSCIQDTSCFLRSFRGCCIFPLRHEQLNASDGNTGWNIPEASYKTIIVPSWCTLQYGLIHKVYIDILTCNQNWFYLGITGVVSQTVFDNCGNCGVWQTFRHRLHSSSPQMSGWKLGTDKLGTNRGNVTTTYNNPWLWGDVVDWLSELDIYVQNEMK